MRVVTNLTNVTKKIIPAIKHRKEQKKARNVKIPGQKSVCLSCLYKWMPASGVFTWLMNRSLVWA